MTDDSGPVTAGSAPVMWDAAFDAMLREALQLPRDAPPMDPMADLQDLGLDSIGAIGLIVALEAHYEVEFPIEAMHPDTFASPAQIWQTLHEARRAVP